MYINFLHLPLFNCVSILHFLSFPLNILLVLFSLFYSPIGTLLLLLLSSFFFSQFCSHRYNFWFPLFAGSIYCTLFLLDCFDFVYGCIYVCVCSVTLFIVVIKLCLYVGLLQFLEFPFSSFFLSSSIFFSFLFFIVLIFNFFKPTIFFLHFFPFFAFPTVLFPLQLTFNVYKSSSPTSI